jgi:hypothetical protein
MYSQYPLNTVLRRTKNKQELGAGSARRVYDLQDGFVLKVAKNKRGINECANEAYIYENIILKYKEFLCPVIQHQEKYIIMPKITTYTELLVFKEITHKQFDNEIMKLEYVQELIDYLITKYDIDEFDLAYSFNWGIYKEKTVLLDYGNTYINNNLMGEYANE